MFGRRVSVLVNERREAGVHEVKFSAKGGSASGGDGSNLAGGVYLYRLQAGDIAEAGRNSSFFIFATAVVQDS